METNQLLTLLDELIGHQQTKVLHIARELAPGITPEDLRNPQDYRILAENQRFNFEDGILAGYLSAKMAVLAELKNKPETR